MYYIILYYVHSQLRRSPHLHGLGQGGQAGPPELAPPRPVAVSNCIRLKYSILLYITRV